MNKKYLLFILLLSVCFGCSDSSQKQHRSQSTKEFSILGEWEIDSYGDNDEGLNESVFVTFGEDGVGQWTNHKTALFSRDPQADFSYDFYYNIEDSILTITANDSSWSERYEVDTLVSSNIIITDFINKNIFILHKKDDYN